MDLIIVDSTITSRKIWKLLGKDNHHKFRIVPLKGFRDLPKQTPKATKSDNLGFDIENDFEYFLDTDQPCLRKLSSELYKSDKVYLGFAGHTSDYRAFVIHEFITNSFPFKEIYRVNFTGFTSDRLFQDLENATKDFDEVFYERELTLRVTDRLTRFLVNNKLRKHKVNFPGLVSYYVLLYILRHTAGADVVIGNDNSIRKHFKTQKAAKSFVSGFDSNKITKTKMSSQEEFYFENNHFLKHEDMLKVYTLDVLNEGLWYLYSNGFITDPTKLLRLTDSEFVKVKEVIEKLSGSEVSYFNNRTRDKEGVYVTDINMYPDRVYAKYQALYRLIWRSTLAAFSKSLKRNDYICFYDKQDVGSYSDIVFDGFSKFFVGEVSKFNSYYHTFKKCSLEKPYVTVTDVVSFFGHRGAYCLKELAKTGMISVTKESKIEPTKSAKVTIRFLSKVYPELFSHKLRRNTDFIISDLLYIKSKADRVEFLNKLHRKMQVPPVNLDTVLCPECQEELSLSIGTSPMFVCKSPKKGGCGSVFSVGYSKGSFVVKENK